MGKASKWIRSFLSGKKDREKGEEKVREKQQEKQSSNQLSSRTENPTTPIVIPPTNPKEKKRWSFRRSAATAATTKYSNSVGSIATTPPLGQAKIGNDNEWKRHGMATIELTVAATNAVAVAAQPPAAPFHLISVATTRPNAVEEAAAIRIQAIFRSYLARKALCALKGLVKLQALVRGHLVRKQATATLRCMQALVTVQARARAQRIRMAEEGQTISQRQSIHRTSLQGNRFRLECNMEKGMEENIKIVEMDFAESRGSLKGRNSHSNHCHSSHPQNERSEHRLSTYLTSHCANMKPHEHLQISPSPSALTEMSPRTYSGHFEEYSFNTALSSPQYNSEMSKPDPARAPFAFPRPECAASLTHDYSFFPSYMANTESSRAKLRSHSAPKQRPDPFERQSSRRRSSIEGRNIPRGVRMQRSSSNAGPNTYGYQNPWLIKLDKSTVSLKDSECGSTSTVLTNNNYCRSLVAYAPCGSKY